MDSRYVLLHAGDGRYLGTVYYVDCIGCGYRVPCLGLELHRNTAYRRVDTHILRLSVANKLMRPGAFWRASGRAGGMQADCSGGFGVAKRVMGEVEKVPLPT